MLIEINKWPDKTKNIKIRYLGLCNNFKSNFDVIGNYFEQPFV